MRCIATRLRSMPARRFRGRRTGMTRIVERRSSGGARPGARTHPLSWTRKRAPAASARPLGWIPAANARVAKECRASCSRMHRYPGGPGDPRATDLQPARVVALAVLADKDQSGVRVRSSPLQLLRHHPSSGALATQPPPLRRGQWCAGSCPSVLPRLQALPVGVGGAIVAKRRSRVCRSKSTSSSTATRTARHAATRKPRRATTTHTADKGPRNQGRSMPARRSRFASLRAGAPDSFRMLRWVHDKQPRLDGVAERLVAHPVNEPHKLLGDSGLLLPFRCCPVDRRRGRSTC